MANSNSGGKMQDKFLTVFAVFDEATQKKLMCVCVCLYMCV